MIKAQDLRIGNLLGTNKDLGGYDYCKVISISETKYETSEGDSHIFGFNYFSNPSKPIPLTEEWLVKFGWVWNEECKSFEKYPNGDARMNLAKKMLGGYDMFNYVLKATICKNIQYVHQLQNLYFALTCEELTIK